MASSLGQMYQQMWEMDMFAATSGSASATPSERAEAILLTLYVMSDEYRDPPTVVRTLSYGLRISMDEAAHCIEELLAKGLVADNAFSLDVTATGIEWVESRSGFPRESAA